MSRKQKLEEILDWIRNKAEEDDLRTIRNISTRVLYGRPKRAVSRSIRQVIIVDIPKPKDTLDEL